MRTRICFFPLLYDYENIALAIGIYALLFSSQCGNVMSSAPATNGKNKFSNIHKDYHILYMLNEHNFVHMQPDNELLLTNTKCKFCK